MTPPLPQLSPERREEIRVLFREELHALFCAVYRLEDFSGQVWADHHLEFWSFIAALDAKHTERTFQSRVAVWMQACFGPEISADRIERNHRFLEEAIELVQANGTTASEAHQLVDYVYGREQGDVNQEVGGVMVTLAALCQASGEDMTAAAEKELSRVWTKIEKIRAKQAAKPKHGPLAEAQASHAERTRAGKVCHVCGDHTDMACSDCHINFGATVRVCRKSSCRDEHERKCFGDGSRIRAEVEEAKQAGVLAVMQVMEEKAEAYRELDTVLNILGDDTRPAADQVSELVTTLEKARAEIEAMRERAAKVAQRRAEGFHTGECERGHVEWDTNAFVCSNRGDCLCIEREEEAEAIAAAIRALPIEGDGQ